MIKYRRINLIAAPGIGKSTLAALVFNKLKIKGHTIEYVQEYVKDWIYDSRPIVSFDQAYLFCKQLHKEDVILRGRDDQIIVTDSPLISNNYYGVAQKRPAGNHLVEIAREFEEKYPSINILLKKSKTIKFEQHGRIHDEDECDKIQKEISDFVLKSYEKSYISNLSTFVIDDADRIMEHIERNL